MVKNKDMQFFMENLKMKRKKDKIFLTFRSGDLNPRFSVIFPPMIWIFMWSEEPEIKSKQASKRDRTLIGVFPTHEIEDVLACFELLPTNPTHRGGNATTTYRDAFWRVLMRLILRLSAMGPNFFFKLHFDF